jgi:hypothetical protein
MWCWRCVIATGWLQQALGQSETVSRLELQEMGKNYPADFIFDRMGNRPFSAKSIH